MNLGHPDNDDSQVGDLDFTRNNVREVPFAGTDNWTMLDLDAWKADFPALADTPYAESSLNIYHEEDAQKEAAKRNGRSYSRRLPAVSDYWAKKEPELAGHFKKVGTEKVKPLLDSRVNAVSTRPGPGCTHSLPVPFFFWFLFGSQNPCVPFLILF